MIGLGFYQSGGVGDVTYDITVIDGEGLLAVTPPVDLVVTVESNEVAAIAGPDTIVLTIPGG